MTSAAVSPSPVDACLGRLAAVLSSVQTQQAELRRERHGKIGRPCCLDPLNGLSESLIDAVPRKTEDGKIVYQAGTEEFWLSALKMRRRPDLRRNFLDRLGGLPEFEDPRRLELVIRALAHSPEFYQWPELQIFRTEWPWLESHTLALKSGNEAVLRRVHAALIPHHPLLGSELGKCASCSSGGVSIFPVNFSSDEQREALRAAAGELLWLVGEWRGWCPLVVAALGSTAGMDAWHAASGIVAAAKDARESLASNCIAIVIERGGKIDGDSLGLGLLLCMLGDLVFKGRPGIPKQWRENIADWVSTGTLDQHRLKPVAWIVSKARAAAAAHRPFVYPAENAKPNRNQYAVHSVPDAVRKVTGFHVSKLARNAAIPGLVLVSLTAAAGLRATAREYVSQPAFIRIETALPAAIADGIDTLRVYGSPALLDIAVRDSANDSQTLVRVRAMQKSEGPRVYFFSRTPEKLAEEMESPVVDGRARIGIEFPYLDAAIVEISILRKGAVRAAHVWKVEKW